MAKKYSQKDLRLLMLKQKSKVESSVAAVEQRIQSPLAKYDAAGNLSCVLCKAAIKSATVWKVHINSKQHKQMVESAKKLKDQLTTASQQQQQQLPPARPSSQSNKIQQNTKTIETTRPVGTPPSHPTPSSNNEEVPEKQSKDDILPDKFFDDPVEDAKARKVEYKDPKEEEWERFQREIKEAATSSNAIIAGEQEESTMTRQIKEIDEQIHQWSRVIQMERRKKRVLQRSNRKPDMKNEQTESSDDDDNDLAEEFPDWRSKKLKLKLKNMQ